MWCVGLMGCGVRGMVRVEIDNDDLLEPSGMVVQHCLERLNHNTGDSLNDERHNHHVVHLLPNVRLPALHDITAYLVLQ